MRPDIAPQQKDTKVAEHNSKIFDISCRNVLLKLEKKMHDVGEN